MHTVKLLDWVGHLQPGRILGVANFQGGKEEAQKLVDERKAEWVKDDSEPAKPMEEK